MLKKIENIHNSQHNTNINIHIVVSEFGIWFGNDAGASPRVRTDGGSENYHQQHRPLSAQKLEDRPGKLTHPHHISRRPSTAGIWFPCRPVASVGSGLHTSQIRDLNQPTVYVVGERSILSLLIRCLQSRTSWLHRPSILRAIWSAHYCFIKLICLAISVY